MRLFRWFLKGTWKNPLIFQNFSQEFCNVILYDSLQTAMKDSNSMTKAMGNAKKKVSGAAPFLLAGAATLFGIPMGVPIPVEAQQLPQLTFTYAFLEGRSNPDHLCRLREEQAGKENQIEEGKLLALLVKSPRAGIGNISADFEILSGSTADASDLGTRKTLENVQLTFGPNNNGSCHYLDIAKDGKLEGDETLSLRLKPKASAYTVSGTGTHNITIKENGAGIRVRYKDIGTLGATPSERSFTLELEAGVPSTTDARSCSFTRDTSFSRSIDIGWAVGDGARSDLSRASEEDFNLPARVTFNKGVAEVTVAAKRDADTAAEDFTIEMAANEMHIPNFCASQPVPICPDMLGGRRVSFRHHLPHRPNPLP